MSRLNDIAQVVYLTLGAHLGFTEDTLVEMRKDWADEGSDDLKSFAHAIAGYLQDPSNLRMPVAERSEWNDAAQKAIQVIQPLELN